MVKVSDQASQQRGPRRARGSVSKNRVGNWQVRYTDPYGKHRVAGTYRKKSDAEQAVARVLSAIENNTWSVLNDTRTDGLDLKTLTLRQASGTYLEGRVNEQGRPLSPNSAKEYPRLIDRVACELADRPLVQCVWLAYPQWTNHYPPELRCASARRALNTRLPISAEEL